MGSHCIDEKVTLGRNTRPIAGASPRSSRNHREQGKRKMVNKNALDESLLAKKPEPAALWSRTTSYLKPVRISIIPIWSCPLSSSYVSRLIEIIGRVEGP